MNKQWSIGIDIGGTKIVVAHVGFEGNVQKQIPLKTNNKEPPYIIQQIIVAINELIKSAKTPPLGIGVGIAGQINANTGVVYFSPNLNWWDVPLKQLLQEQLRLTVIITNDVRAATLGEWLYGAGRGVKDLVCVFVGTGIGGGIVSNGHLLQGNTNTAGEIGHLTINLKGNECACGNHGCMESIASGWAIAKQTQSAVAKDKIAGKRLLSMVQGNVAYITAKTTCEAALLGDPLALNIIEQASEALIAGTVSIVNILNPQIIVFGGGVINGYPKFIELIDEGVRKRALQAACKSLQIVRSQLHPNSGVIGAASLVFKKH